MPEIRREDWFQPPEGILEGTHTEIALGYIARARADVEYNSTDPFGVPDPEVAVREILARVEMIALLESEERDVINGDEGLANMLFSRVLREVRELERGERFTVTGEAHLLKERIAKAGAWNGDIIDSTE